MPERLHSMNINKLFPSKWVGATDLNGKTPTLTMKSVTIEQVGAPPQTEEKPVIWFDKATKGLILNKTNAMVIAGLYGPETDNWPGKKIQLYTAKVKAFGAVHDAIRVRSAGTVSAAPDPVVEAEPEDVTDFEAEPDLDDITVDDAPADTAAHVAAPTDGNGSQPEPKWEADGPDVGDGGDGPKLTAADKEAMQAAVVDAIDADHPFDGITSREQVTLDAWSGKTFTDIQQWLVDNSLADNLSDAKTMYQSAKKSVVGDAARVTKDSAPDIKLALLRLATGDKVTA